MTALTGRVALVTGGNGGIGLGMAKGMAAAGADIVIWGRNETKNADAVATIEAIGRRAAAFVVDAGDEQQIVETLAASIEAMGHVDVAIANAGTSRGGVAITDVTLDAWRLVHRLNLDGVFLLFREAARHMIDRGEGGSLIAVSSTASIHGPAGNHSYASSKTAVLGLVRSLAVELARHGIRVNALCPGWTITELAAAGYENDLFRTATTKRTPVRRWADPEEFGDLAAYLADPSITFHTGDTIVMDGGYTIF